MNSQQKCLPASLEGFSLQDLSLLCTCGHFVNVHSEGLGAYPSICEESDCACINCEVDVGLTILVNYFERKVPNRPRVETFTKFPNYIFLGNYGVPLIMETVSLPFRPKGEYWCSICGIFSFYRDEDCPRCNIRSWSETEF